MTYFSDRERIECALPARLVWHVAMTISDASRDATDDAGRAELASIVSGLEASFNATLTELSDADRYKLARRLYRVCQLVTSDLEDRPVATALVAARELVAQLITLDLWDMDPAFDQAWDRLAEAVYGTESNGALLDQVDRSGTRYGRKALDRLQAEGYYRRAAVGVAA
jgi:hypothetical protein